MALAYPWVLPDPPPGRLVHRQDGVMALQGTPEEWRQWGEGVLCTSGTRFPPLRAETGIPPLPSLASVPIVLRWSAWNITPDQKQEMSRMRKTPAEPRRPFKSHHLEHPGRWIPAGYSIAEEQPEWFEPSVHDDLLAAGLL